MLEIANFSKSYNNHLIISVENLAIGQGIHWFKGANGSGKSTFFRAIAGIIPFEGSIIFNNLDSVKNAVAYRMAINMSEAEPQFPDYLTAFDLIKFIADAKKASNEQMMYLAEKLGVSAYWKTPIGSYSSGMLKKVSLLTAFLGKPQLIILDEPLITIDTQAVEIVYQLVKEYFEQQQTTFLFSSHQDIHLGDVSLANLAVKHTYLVQNKGIEKL